MYHIFTKDIVKNIMKNSELNMKALVLKVIKKLNREGRIKRWQ